MAAGSAPRRADPRYCWIPDPRTNRTGCVRLEPMLAGLAPLRFRGATGEVRVISLEPDSSFLVDGRPGQRCTSLSAPSDVALAGQPVGVLIGNQKMGPGETVAIALAGREHPRVFGEPAIVPLLDGSLLIWMVGPQGAIYPDGIAPDVTVSPGSVVQPLTEDPVVDTATDWLRQQPGCAPDTATPAG